MDFTDIFRQYKNNLESFKTPNDSPISRLVEYHDSVGDIYKINYVLSQNYHDSLLTYQCDFLAYMFSFTHGRSKLSKIGKSYLQYIWGPYSPCERFHPDTAMIKYICKSRSGYIAAPIISVQPRRTGKTYTATCLLAYIILFTGLFGIETDDDKTSAQYTIGLRYKEANNSPMGLKDVLTHFNRLLTIISNYDSDYLPPIKVTTSAPKENTKSKTIYYSFPGVKIESKVLQKDSDRGVLENLIFVDEFSFICNNADEKLNDLAVNCSFSNMALILVSTPPVGDNASNFNVSSKKVISSIEITRRPPLANLGTDPTSLSYCAWTHFDSQPRYAQLERYRQFKNDSCERFVSECLGVLYDTRLITPSIFTDAFLSNTGDFRKVISTHKSNKSVSGVGHGARSEYYARIFSKQHHFVVVKLYDENTRSNNYHIFAVFDHLLDKTKSLIDGSEKTHHFIIYFGFTCENPIHVLSAHRRVILVLDRNGAPTHKTLYRNVTVKVLKKYDQVDMSDYILTAFANLLKSSFTYPEPKTLKILEKCCDNLRAVLSDLSNRNMEKILNAMGGCFYN